MRTEEQLLIRNSFTMVDMYITRRLSIAEFSNWCEINNIQGADHGNHRNYVGNISNEHVCSVDIGGLR